MSARLWLDNHAKQHDWEIRSSPTRMYVDYVRENVEVRTEFDRRGGLKWIGRYVSDTLDVTYGPHDPGKRETATGWLSAPPATAPTQRFTGGRAGHE